ncbi:response regulator [Pelagibacterium sp. 26DY04]|uniref:response regulator n=1 Tax=Pelagibacterium sp. 26DY04 TaxID=2967130 RepID=UPI0028157F73|nr:response regulator [Pelagibacterium sp. 26DY04]WMT85266.1 response regulator [Pelagibacterium sp. 26DY04]
MGIVAILEDLGHTVVPATSGSDTLGKLRSRSDIALGFSRSRDAQDDGLQLVDGIRQEWQHLPILLATSNVAGSDHRPASARKALHPRTT